MKDGGYHSVVLPVTVTAVLTFVLISVLAGAVDSYQRPRPESSHLPHPSEFTANAEMLSQSLDVSAIHGQS